MAANRSSHSVSWLSRPGFKCRRMYLLHLLDLSGRSQASRNRVTQLTHPVRPEAHAKVERVTDACPALAPAMASRESLSLTRNLLYGC